MTELDATWKMDAIRLAYRIYELPRDSAPMGVAGHGGRACFSMHGGIGMLDADTGKLTKLQRPQTAMAESLVRAPNGDIWFADTSSGLLCRIRSDNTIDSFPLGRGSRPTSIVLASSTSGWLGLSAARAIVEFSDGEIVAQHEVGGRPAAIGRLMDGSVWSLEPGALSCLGLPQEPNNLPASPDPSRNAPTNIAMLAGDLWFGNIGRDEICRLTADRRLIRYRLGRECAPFWLATGPDNAIWFTTMGAGTLCRIDAKGNVARLAASQAGPIAPTFVAGDDEGLWLTSFPPSAAIRIPLPGKPA